MTGSAVAANEIEALELFFCRRHGDELILKGDELHCRHCGLQGRLEEGVFKFLIGSDEFYEGRYNNRTRYVPRGDGYLATLPLRIVQQGYPTTVAQQIVRGKTVLDIGSAGGSDWFASRYRMIGLDLSMAALKDIAERYAVAVQASAVEIPLKNESVDAVISTCVFEHFIARDKDRVLSECYRLLRPGGKLVFFYDVSTENPVISSYRRRDPENYKVQFLDGDGHVGYSSVDENRAHFMGAGFSIIGEAFHERTPVLSNSVWQKLSRWPGVWGRAAGIGDVITSGAFRLPALIALTLTDATFGQVLPIRYARCMTTVAQKQ